MSRAMALSRFGGPEVLEMCAVPQAAPGPGEIRIRHAAIGVNFTDVHGRRGDYRDLHELPKPLVLGMEAVGVVEATGLGVERFRTGDRVAYASRPLGAYCEARNFPAARCVPVPEGLADEVVAATFLKGLTGCARSAPARSASWARRKRSAAPWKMATRRSSCTAGTIGPRGCAS